MMGALAGPMVGLFILGLFVKRAGKWGAFIGLLVSAVFNMWICFGSFITKPYAGYALPTNSSAPPPPYDPHYGKPDVFYMYKISGFLYPTIGIFLCLIVGILVSLVLPDSPAAHKEGDDYIKDGLIFQMRNKKKINIETKKVQDSHL